MTAYLAVDKNGYKEWRHIVTDKLHNVEDAAVIYPDGESFYYLNGHPYKFIEWNRLRRLQAFT